MTVPVPGSSLIRLLPPLGCPGESFWVVPVEVNRWLQQGCRRAPVPALPLELTWLVADAGPLQPSTAVAIDLVITCRQPPPTQLLTIDWGDDNQQQQGWPQQQTTLRLRHLYNQRRDTTVTAALQPLGLSCALDVALQGCPLWPAPPPPPAPGSLRPLIPGPGLLGQAFDGSSSQQWCLQRWAGGDSSGGVPASTGNTDTFLRADGQWATPPGSNGTRWFRGNGPPGVIPEAKAGDFYLDTRSGDLYQLETT